MSLTRAARDNLDSAPEFALGSALTYFKGKRRPRYHGGLPPGSGVSKKYVEQVQ
jgi:hypothetical protein